MPLKDRDRDRPRRLQRLGIIRLGYKEKRKRNDGSEYEMPVQADHFVLTDAPEIAGVYGEQPRELDVLLPFPDVERNFDANYTVWAGGVLICQGDGDYVNYAAPHKIEKRKAKNNKVYTSVRNAAGDTLVSNGLAQVDFAWNGEQFAAGTHVPCPGAAGDKYPHCAACGISAILKVMMARPDLFRLGYYQIATGSGRNYDTILGTLELIASQAGRVSGIPFKLRLVKEPTTYQMDGKRKKTEKWFLQLEPEPEFTRRLYRQQAAKILGDDGPVAQLSAGQDFDEWDEPAPPPVAHEVIDIETGEIVENEPEAEPADRSLEWAANVKTGKGRRFGELNHDQLQVIVDNSRSANRVEAATMLLDRISVKLASAESEDGTSANLAQMTFEKMMHGE